MDKAGIAAQALSINNNKILPVRLSENDYTALFQDNHLIFQDLDDDSIEVLQLMNPEKIEFNKEELKSRNFNIKPHNELLNESLLQCFVVISKNKKNIETFCKGINFCQEILN